MTEATQDRATRPEDYKTRLDALTELHRQRHIERAQSGYLEMLRDYPDDAELHYRLALTHHQLDAEETCLQYLDQAAQLDPRDSRVFNLRGNVHHSLGQYRESSNDYRAAIAIDPDYARAYNNLGLSLKALDQLDAAEEAYRQAIARDPHYADAYFNLAMTLEAKGDVLGAINALQRCLELNHADQEAMLRLAMLTGNQSEHASERLVQGMFDQYAESFEKHLQEGLGYRTPTEMAALFLEHSGATRVNRMLDLGCGTGLSGVAFRDFADYFIGVDLSAKMLEKAAEKELYQELHAAELVAYLQQPGEAFDLFVSSDVLVYMGDLQPLFEAMAARASKGAWCLLSAEISDEPGFHLQKSARFAHHPDYMRGTAAAAGFQLLTQRSVQLRREADGWIQGNIYLYRYEI